MPELPEVQSFVDALNKHFAGKTIDHLHLRRKDLRLPFDHDFLHASCGKGRLLRNFARSGKLILLRTDQAQVEISLGMTGHFAPADLRQPQLHEHVTLEFTDGTALAFIDPRRFGFWRRPLDSRQQIPADPLSTAELKALFSTPRARSSSRNIKDFLMDQSFIGGIGNIYALEALFAAGVAPTRRCETLASTEWARLATAIPEILNRAIAAGGSSIATYRQFGGSEGGFQKQHQVYDREGEKCPRRSCRGVITRIPHGGRSSWFCPLCQR